MRSHWFWILCACTLQFAACQLAPRNVEITQSQSLDSLEIQGLVDVSDIPNGWQDLLLLDSTIQLDIRYAGTNNFVAEKLYPCARCLLRSEVAQSVVKAQRLLQNNDLGLKIFDCYRPLSVQQRLWNKVPDARYVTPPERGSMHNRGTAIDVTLVYSNGDELDMGTAFDYFGQEAHHSYKALSAQVLDNRRHLLEVMQLTGFKEIRTEWWHYSYKEKEFDVQDFVWPCQNLD
ncbi:MAG: M15 family metallopeptidase [Saprospiraceae bacterium]|nr:M15 family metallopeptidase [Saprospiraceae bacterium]